MKYPKKPLPPLAEIERLLVVKTSSLGDVIHALPVVEAIKQARPGLELGWVVRARCADVLRGNPWIDHLHVVADKPSWRGLWRLRADLRARRYGCALDMQGLFLSGLIAWLSGAPVRLGLDRNREGNRLFLTHADVPGKLGGSWGDRHAVDILYGFAERLGVAEPHPSFAAQPYLAGGAAPVPGWPESPRPRVALNVGASWVYKRWPVSSWAAVADGLVAERVGVVFVGDARDAEAVAQVKAQMRDPGPVADVSGRTGLRQLARVLAECDLLVSADSGPMHLAVAVGTPTVALFGATNPDRTGPYGAGNLVLNRHLSCSPCYRHPTCAGRVDCMTGIPPAEVLEAIRTQLARNGDSHRQEPDAA